jgi:hypothetical protein
MAQTELEVDCEPLGEEAMAPEENNKSANAQDADTHEYLIRI